MKSAETNERGRIILMLYDCRRDGTTTISALRRALDDRGLSLSINDLKVRLAYLEKKGYVELLRRNDLPGYRAELDRPGGGRSDDIVTVALSAKGEDLCQRSIPADPGVDLEL